MFSHLKSFIYSIIWYSEVSWNSFCRWGRAERSRCRRARGLFGVAGSQGATGFGAVIVAAMVPNMWTSPRKNPWFLGILYMLIYYNVNIVFKSWWNIFFWGSESDPLWNNVEKPFDMARRIWTEKRTTQIETTNKNVDTRIEGVHITF